MAVATSRPSLVRVGLVVLLVGAIGGVYAEKTLSDDEPTAGDDGQPRPLVGNTDPNGGRWGDPGFGQPLRLTVRVDPGDGPIYVGADELLGATEGWAGCTGQTRLTWEADGPVLPAIAEAAFVYADFGDKPPPIIAPGVAATEGSMVLNECEIPAFANVYYEADANSRTVTVAIEATTHEWTCLDEVYALDADEREAIAPNADC